MTEIKVMVGSEKGKLGEEVREILSSETQIKIVAESNKEREIIELAQKLKPEIILLALSSLKKERLELISLFKGKEFSPKIIIIIDQEQKELILEGLKRGALGYLLRNKLKFTARAIKSVYRGDAWISRKMAAEILEELNRLYRICSAEGF